MKPKGITYKRAQWSLKRIIEDREKGSNPLSWICDINNIKVTHVSRKSAWFTVQIPASRVLSIPMAHYDHRTITENGKKIIIFRDGHQYARKEDFDMVFDGVSKEIYESRTASSNRKFLIIDQTGREVFSNSISTQINRSEEDMSYYERYRNSIMESYIDALVK